MNSQSIARMSSYRLRRMLDIIEGAPNGDALLPTMAARLRAELAQREQRMVADYVSEGLGE